jgi:hypothetical protein
MDNTRLTIACEENREGGYEIEVTFERDSRTKFREAFISLDRPMPPYLIEESDINGVGAVKSATTAILSHIIGVINKSLKTDSHIFTDKEIDSMFEFKELYTIKRFAEIAGVKFDESKFKNRKEFQEYFAKWLDSQRK